MKQLVQCVTVVVALGLAGMMQTGCDESDAVASIDEAASQAGVQSNSEYAGNLTGTWQGGGL